MNSVLIVGAPNTGKVRICQHITGDNDTATIESNSHSGLFYNHELVNKYYKVNLNLLVEEFPAQRLPEYTENGLYEEFRSWYNDFISDEYKELREVLDGIILTVDMNNSSQYVEKCVEIVDKIRTQFEVDVGGEWDGFVIVAGAGDGNNAGEIENVVLGYGFEFVDINKTGVNEFKEKLGKDRIYEVLECHDWQTEKSIGETGEDDKKSMARAQEMARGLLDDEKEVDLDMIFAKLQVAKEKALSMGEEEKKAYVEKVIQETIGFI